MLNNSLKNILFPTVILLCVVFITGCSSPESKDLKDAPLDLGYVEDIDAEDDEKNKEAFSLSEDELESIQQETESNSLENEENEETETTEFTFNKELSDSVNKHIYKGNVDKQITKDEFVYFVQDLSSNFEQVKSIVFTEDSSDIDIYLNEGKRIKTNEDTIREINNLIVKVYTGLSNEDKDLMPVDFISFISDNYAYTGSVVQDFYEPDSENDAE